MTDSREIVLADGTVLTIEYTPQFVWKVCKFFNLTPDEVPNDEHLKEFFVRCMSAA